MIKIILIMILVSNLLYSKSVEKLKVELKQEKNRIIIKVLKSDTKNEKKIINHLIKKGETLSEIALKYKKKIKEIAKDNNIKNVDFIKSGDSLKIR